MGNCGHAGLVTRPRRIVIAVFDGVELLDVTGPAEVFSVASRLIRPGGRRYRVELAAAEPQPVRTPGGLWLTPDVRFDDLAGPVDTIVVPGGLTVVDGRAEPLMPPEVVRWARDWASMARRVASVCSGAHVLAAAGLLDGRRATTHWHTAGRLAADHPAVEVDPDPIFIRDGRVWTGAGVSAGMDLSLALVAADHGEDLARQVARWMVMYLKRPGGQSQFSVPLSTDEPADAGIADLLRWVVEHPDADLSVAALAARAHLSDRHLARVFVRQTGRTPGEYVDAARVEAARRLLEETAISLESVAQRSGFGSTETLYRSFRRRVGSTPAQYRRRFTSAGVS
jgi:transcriptional regulator GlxA family with amidase domain